MMTPLSMRRIAFSLGLCALGLLSGCSSGSEEEEATAADTQPKTAAASETAGRVVLSPTAFQATGVQIEVAAARATDPSPGGLVVPGHVELDSSRIAVVSPRVGGRLERLAAASGQTVGAGQIVAYLSSPEYLGAQADLAQAARRAALLQNTQDAAGAAALVEAARQRLLLIGGTEAQIRRVLDSGETSLLLPIPAPVSGTILEALAQSGVALEAGGPIFRMADLSVVNVVAQVPEASVAAVTPGMRSEVTVAAYPSRAFGGSISRILEQLDLETRTARVVIQVPNPGRALKSGMFGTVRIYTPRLGPAAGQMAISLPAAAVLADGEQRFVFVQTGERVFEKRLVEIALPEAGAAPSNRVQIASGLQAGERVVVVGAFVLRSELAKANLVDDD